MALKTKTGSTDKSTRNQNVPGLVAHCRASLTRVEAYLVTVSSNPHQKIVWLDVSVNEILVVYILDPTNHLRDKHRMTSGMQTT